MANTYQDAKLNALAGFLPAEVSADVEAMQAAFEANRHRIYSLAFWMTDNELSAEELMSAIFGRAFAGSDSPSADVIDAALITEITNATTFLQLSQAWQYWFLGLMTLISAGVYSQARRVRADS